MRSSSLRPAATALAALLVAMLFGAIASAGCIDISPIPDDPSCFDDAQTHKVPCVTSDAGTDADGGE